MVRSIGGDFGIGLSCLFGALLAFASACSGESSADGTGGSTGSAGLNGTAAGAAGRANSGGVANAAGGRNSSGGVANATGGSSSGGATNGTGGVDLSSDPGSGACQNFTPCGGDVLGTWRVESLCLDAFPNTFASCPQATTTVSLQNGVLTFNSDGTYVPSGTSVTRTTLPAACAAECAAGACTASADGGCVCEAAVAVNETPLAWSATGNQLIVSPRSGVTQTAYYCRTANQLMMRGWSTANTRYEYDLRR